MGSIKHAKTSPVPNPLGDTRRVGGGDWNSEHVIDLDVSDIDGLEARLIPVDQVEQFRDDALAFRNEAAGSASDAAASAAEAAATVGALAAPGGAELVGAGSEGTVQDALDVRPTETTLAADGGGDLVGFKQAGAGASLRTVQSKLRDTVYLRDFGAVGDGIADDTAAIVAAIASLPSTGGEVCTGRGKFLFSSTITINKPITIRGEGSGTVNNGSTGTALVKASTLNGDGIVLASLGAKLATLSVQGQAGNGGDGVVVLESRCELDRISVFAAGQDNIRIGKDTAPSNVNLWKLWDCKSKNAGRHNLHISDKVRPTLPDANAGICYGGDFQSGTECGVYLGNCAFNLFIGLCVQTNGTYGLRCSPSSMNNKFVGGDYEVNGRVGGSGSTSYLDIWVESGSADNDFDGVNTYNFPVTFLDEGTRTSIDKVRAITLTAGSDNCAGIQLPNVASTLPKMLDWYEETTFTPVLNSSGGGAASGGTTGTVTGYATRIGNSVKFRLSITWTGHTGSGTMTVGGLPWASANHGFTAVSVVPNNMIIPAGSVVAAMVIPNSFSINLYSVTTASPAIQAALALDTSATLYIAGEYEAA